MAASQPAGGLFTVEQLELIRRLRNSGVTKEQIVNAFDSLERLDKELGPIYNIPVTLTAQIQCMQSLGLSMVGLPLPQHMQNGNSGGQPISSIPSPIQAPTTPSRKRSHDSSEITNIDIPNLTNGFHTPQLEEEEDTEEFKEFVMKGDISCYDEIRQFVAAFNIRQQQVAILAGVSQSYVSRYLKGDFADMSERSRRAIQRWYIKYKNDPGSITPHVNVMMMNSNNQGSAKKMLFPGNIDMANNPDFLNYPKRERFVFRPAHLEVLEKYYMEDNYPSQEKREEIARACNSIAAVPGRALSEREKVSAQIISNWFANKRKEMKKIAREEGIDVSQVPLRGRGRPRLFASDMGQIQQFNESSNVSLEEQESAQETTKQTEPLNLSEEDSSANPQQEKRDNFGNDPADEQSLSLAVEVAAVNQAILALSGTTPITVKAEKPD